MEKTPLVSIIIPTKNSASTLEACLKSIQQQTYTHVECIIIDNFSTDATEQLAKKYQCNFKKAGNERSRQRNIGANISNGEYLLFIDSDMELSSDLVKELVTTMQTKKQLCAITFPEISFGSTFWAACKAFERSKYTTTNFLKSARGITKKGFLMLGGYDESLIGFEDFDFHIRIKNIFGKDSIANATHVIRHNEGALTLRTLWKKKYYYGLNLLAYQEKHSKSPYFSLQTNVFTRISLLISHPMDILLHPLLLTGTCYMKITEFIAGGLGHLNRRAL